LDVRLARDGVPVVIHDATLQRTCSRTERVAQMTSAQLDEVDAGAWFNRARPALAQDEYTREHVPTLEKVFQLVTNRDCMIYVEIKTDDEPSVGVLVQSIVDLLSRYRFEDRVVVVSFNLEAIAQAKQLNPTIRTGALFAPRRGAAHGLRAEKILAAAKDCGADQMFLHRLIARPRLISRASEQNLPVVVWTVDDHGWLQRAENLGVHALITNDPALFRAPRSSFDLRLR
jgi:glycerophosphoryl diester phosphodiesterase